MCMCICTNNVRILTRFFLDLHRFYQTPKGKYVHFYHITPLHVRKNKIHTVVLYLRNLLKIRVIFHSYRAPIYVIICVLLIRNPEY